MPSLAELAEDTLVHVLPQRGVERIDRGDFVFISTGNTATVQRIRLGDVAEAVAWVRAAAAERNGPRLEWWVGWHATPEDLGERLLALGLVPDDEEAVLTGMTCDTEPRPSPDIEVRRILTLEEQLAALEVDWAVWAHKDRERRAETERRRFDPNGTVHHFAAYDDGRPIGFGRAVDMDAGVALLGGAVLPAYRGRGVYRALVRARWEHAAARGTPLLVVQAGHMSAPVLDGLGFVRHGDLRLFAEKP